MLNSVAKGSFLSLHNYTRLISELPYLDQSFETKKATWTKYEKDSFFNTLLKSFFDNDRKKISRNNIFQLAKENNKMGIVATILWGYPRNMRGNSFEKILINLSKIEEAVCKDSHLTQQTFSHLLSTLSGQGIGLSTLSKLLYFFNVKLEGHPCLILDQRIIKVLSLGLFEELQQLSIITEINKHNYYHLYIERLHTLSHFNNYKPSQLEMFLFMFGNNLSVDNISVISSHKSDLK